MIGLLIAIVSMVIVLSVVVTVHELGHYWAARACGVAIDRFSIGFGAPLISWRDKHGVEWRIASIPLGGYVRFAGDENAASVPDQNDLDAMKREIADREGAAALKQYFHFKPVWQRAIIAAAGPIANFILAILVFAVMQVAIGDLKTQVIVQAIEPKSAAAAAGFKPADVIVKMDGRAVESYRDVAAYVSLRAKLPVQFTVQRAQQTLELTATPTLVEQKDEIAGRVKVGRLGVSLGGRGYFERSSVWMAIPRATVQVWDMLKTIGFYLGRLVTGQLPADQISGIIGIGKTAGAVTQASVEGAPDLKTMIIRTVASQAILIASLSVSIGFMNLLPIPVLDGGHLLLYAYEAVFRRPLRADFQAAGFRAGLALILCFMLFAAWNDLNRYDVFKFIGGLFT
ncbi:RIP metalloprotease [Caulobacter sp. CCNWLY153]|jgi:regulator of sigma E protease|uniref:RIP metalloprotease RseP n=1 Tax=Caulobacter radicis TaxID=2172650 RepID=A0A2T9JW94_9CAUL|nr:RIP metalloprotease [Caulobacter radicis]PVM87966.1 RIP metalloprotease RseP [Caulobacter radicis]